MPYPKKKKLSRLLSSKSKLPIPKSARPTLKHRRNPANRISKPLKLKFAVDLSRSQYIYGKNAVLEALKKSPRKVQKIYIGQTKNQLADKKLEAIIALAKESLSLIQSVPAQKLNELLDSHLTGQAELIHQGVVALVIAAPLMSLEEWLSTIQAKLQASSKGLVIALDEITDQHNIGAIIRVAETMGALGILLPKHRGGSISPVASKASSGADKYIPLVQVGNMNLALKALKQAGFWILGSQCDPTATPFYQYDFSNLPTVLVMGSEGKGLRPSIVANCDMLGLIPMYGQIQSLNVATATAIMAYEIVTQQKNSA